MRNAAASAGGCHAAFVDKRWLLSHCSELRLSWYTEIISLLGGDHMANIVKRSDGRWRARYRDNAGKEHSRHFKRKVDAQRWLDVVTTGMYVDPGRSRITVAEWSRRWLETKARPEAVHEGALRRSVARQRAPALARRGAEPSTSG